MSRLTIYVIKEISSSFLFTLILLTGILWLGQGLRHLELLTNDYVQLSSYLSYVLFLLPKMLQLTAPIALFLSVLFCLNRMRSDSELIVLWASGKSNRNILLKPILIFSTFVYLALMVLSIYITPYSLNEIRHKIIDIRSSGIHSGMLKEKKFISPVDTLTIFMQEKDGNNILGLLIHDLTNPNKPNTYIAEKGEFIHSKKIKILRLFNGNVQILNKEDKIISEVSFETYDLNLTPYNKQESAHIYADELKTFEILSKIKSGNSNSEDFAELNNRIINPFYIFCLALLPLLIFKFPRRPDEGWTVPISLISISALLIKILEITLSNLLISNNSLIILNYTIPISITLLILILLYFNDFEKNKLKNVFQN